MITITLTQEEADFLRRLLEREAETAPPEDAEYAAKLRDCFPAGPPAIRTAFDALHRRFDFFATLPEMKQQIVKLLQQHGLDERTAMQMASGYLLGGESFGHAHAIDAANLNPWVRVPGRALQGHNGVPAPVPTYYQRIEHLSLVD
jgi:hypothetical protein